MTPRVRITIEEYSTIECIHMYLHVYMCIYEYAQIIPELLLNTHIQDGSFVSSSEAPEEVYDPRSLYERLQEQKEKKQEEFEEQFKFSKLL